MAFVFQLGEEDRRANATEIVKMLTPILSRTGGDAEDEQIFDVPGLAEYLGVSKDWVYKQVAHQGIPHVKTNHLVRFRKTAIDRWLEERTVKPVPKNPAEKYLSQKGAGDV
jgi:excisionase family DNA binding protein